MNNKKTEKFKKNLEIFIDEWYACLQCCKALNSGESLQKNLKEERRRCTQQFAVNLSGKRMEEY